MKTVAFIKMKDGTKEEYLMLDKYEQDYINQTADRILKFMGGLKSTLEDFAPMIKRIFARKPYSLL